MRERIALLLGVPVTDEELRARAADPHWDYGRQLMSAGSLERAFEAYRPALPVAADLLRRAAACGVSVYREARLAHLAEASRTNDTLIVVAHWRGSAVQASDLLDGWEVPLAGGDGDGPLALLAREIARRSAEGEPSTALKGERTGSRRVALCMNHIIETGALRPFLPAGLAIDIATDRLMTETLSRDLFDLAFEGRLRPGNQLELADGLHSLAAINHAIAPDFQGVIDLSCCTSSILATYLRFERTGLDTIAGDDFVVPAPQMRLLERTLELLMLEPTMRYATARRALAHGLGDLRREEQRRQ